MGSSRLTKIGKYEVVELIGRGGMGVVYKAVDPAIGRLVAIKMITGGVGDDPDLLKRFYREAQSTGSLQHPNIVTVYDLGDDGGSPYLVMEFLEGESLEAVIHSRREMVLAEKLSLMVQVCDGLDYAHRRNVVHRDIKPANIVITKDGGVKIVDFGIARFGNDRFTRTGQVMGSIYYMSPEQINGEETDSRTDIYSTGVVLFEFLTNELPFRGENTSATLVKILCDPPPLLSTYLRTHTAELDQIIARALAKVRNERYSSVEEFAFDLQRLQEESRRELIGSYLSSAEISIEQSDWNKAKENLRQVLKLDRQHTRANELVREVQSRIQKQQVKQQLLQLRAHSEEAFKMRQWDDALSYVNQAIELEPDRELIHLRDSIHQSRSQLKDALHRAEAAHGSGDLEIAKSAVDEALAVDPGDTHAKALKAIIVKELTDRAKRRSIEELLAQAHKEVASQRFTAALELLKKADALEPGAPDVQQLVAFALMAQEQEKRKLALNKASGEIEELLNKDEYGAAVARAEDALVEFPEDPGLLRLRTFAEKQRETWKKRLYIDSQIGVARELLYTNRPADALEVVQKALQLYPQEASLLSLLSIVNEAVAREQDQIKEIERKRQQAAQIASKLEEARNLEQNSQTKNALELIDEALTQHPESDQLKAYAATLRASLARRDAELKAAEEDLRRRRVSVELELKTARQLLNSRQFDKAMAHLEEATRRYPESEELQRAIANARELQEQEQSESETKRNRAAAIEGEIKVARQLLAEQQNGKALAVLEGALRRYPDSAELQSQVAEMKETVAISKEAARDAIKKEGEARRLLRDRDLAELNQMAERPRQEMHTGRVAELRQEVQRLQNRYLRDPEIQAAASNAIRFLDAPLTPVEQPEQPAQTLPPSATTLFRSETIAISDRQSSAPSTPISSTKAEAASTTSSRQKVISPQPQHHSGRQSRRFLLTATAAGIVFAAFVTWAFWASPKPIVRIETLPSGAKVTVGGQTCITPNCKIKLATGNYQLEAQLDGYEEASRSFTVNAKQADSTITLNLSPLKTSNESHPQFSPGPIPETTTVQPTPPPAGHLQVTGAPPGSEIFADGNRLGRVGRTGSLSADILPGDHQIKIFTHNRESAVVSRHFSPGHAVLMKGREFTFPVTGQEQKPAVVQQGEQSDWLRVKDSNDITQVSQFLQRYPNGTYRMQAESKQEDLWWSRDYAGNTPLALRDYLRRYPNGKYSQSANGELAKLEWQSIANTKDVAVLETFLKTYTSGEYHDKASSRLDDVVWEQSNRGNDAESLRKYVQTFPSGKHATEAREEMARLVKPKVPPPAEAATAETPIIDDKTAILSILKAYAKAYEEQDLGALQKLWPSMTQQQTSGVGDFFRDASSVKLTYILMGSPRVAGNIATLEFRQEISYVMNGKFQKPIPAKVNMRVTKANAGGPWQIDSIH